jgi:phage repressor protein C with HTH and peptisase S24 domain
VEENHSNKTSDLASEIKDDSGMQSSLGDRVKRAREALGLSQQALASKVGVSLTTIQNYEGGKFPKGEHAVSLARSLGCTIDWLLTGEGPAFDPKRIKMEFARAGVLRAGDRLAYPAFIDEADNAPCTSQKDDLQWMPPVAVPSMGYALVPKVKARLRAGTGSLETEGEVIGYYAFKLDFLQRKGRPKKMVLMDVAGDSMEPDIWNRDTVLIDESQREIIAGAMFAVGIENEVFVKYLLRVPGKLILQSRNERYAPIEVDMNGDIIGTVRVIGRVVWSCREYVR